ncbi:MAG: anaerobic sulfatase maturase [Deltaproteobacteria bacterium]|nr:anaerobic sulfatase maturase [Deltaproteobacteria bacterium]
MKPEIDTNQIIRDVLVKPAGPDCNLACTYCFYLAKAAMFRKSTVHRMSEDILEALVKGVMRNAGDQVSFGWQGGEPTLMGVDFFQHAVDLQQKYGQGQTLGNGLQTNGMLINQPWTRFLSQYNFLVGLSLDGPEHIHDRYRTNHSGRSTWHTVFDAGRRLMDAGVAVNVLTVVNDYSSRFPEEIYKFHKSNGFPHMQFIPCVETDSVNGNLAAPFSVSAESYGAFLCKLFDLWLGDFENGEPTTFIRMFDSLFYTYVDLIPPDCNLRKTCGNYVVVEHNGDVFSCDFFVESQWKLGNVLHDDIADLLFSERQHRFGNLKAELPEACRACRWLPVCQGGCPKDRIRDRRDKGLNHFCSAYRMFYAHADPHYHRLAKAWKRQTALAKAEDIQRQIALTGVKVGRNAPCPCGSGKKYKKCCGTS